MGPVKSLGALIVTALLLSGLTIGNSSVSATALPAENTNSLFAQSAAQILEREFSSPNISYFLLDARTGTLLASRWDDPEKPVPLGSLVKPFVALSYAEQHHFQYPTHFCRGEASGCWLPRGHGKMNITSAIAYSCNSYFRMLTENMRGADVAPVATRFGFEAPRDDLSGPVLIGVGSRWRISPLHMAHAYMELARRRDQPAVREILAGMAESARQGTGASVGQAIGSSTALVKTGTAPCTHSNHAPGDGLVVTLVPAEQPQALLMVRVHGVPGAKAATTAGRMLQRIKE